MDDELRILEEELKRLHPAAPSRALVARVERELKAGAEPRPALHYRWFWIAALPVAAAVTIMVVQLVSRPGSPRASTSGAPSSPEVVASRATSGALLKPVAAENLLVSARDEGLVILDDGTQARRERRQYIDTITWKNPRTHASLIWSVPREEVLVVPIAFQ